MIKNSAMISPEKAFEIIHSIPLPESYQTLAIENCIGYPLAENIFADRDFPPFDRVMMDGICVKDFGQNEWPIEAIVFAGEKQIELKNHSAAIEIMTGAALPKNCTTVIKIEDLDFFEKEGSKWVKLKDGISAENNQFIHYQGMDAKKGEIIVSNQTILGPIEIALAASVGKTELKVVAKPNIGIFSSGDEIVNISETPLDHQIRVSNSVMIQAKLKSLGYQTEIAHLIDEKSSIFNTLEKALLKNDILLISGGVSAGKKDFLPEVLNELGFETLIHKIAQKPGKPLWVGKNKEGKVIFAFPGNPISTLVCFYAYFLPWIQEKEVFMGNINCHKLPKAFEKLGHWIPVQQNKENGFYERLTHNGSGDLIHWQKADALIYQASNSIHTSLPFIPLK
ncbi:MAG: molybdopterin molybdotransferase MoeA [Aquirufa sp.]